MDLIQQYLNKVERIKGVYVLHVDTKDTTYKEINDIADQWNRVMPGESLFLVPKNWGLQYRHHFHFGIAMTLLHAGEKIRRECWSDPDLHIQMDGMDALLSEREISVRIGRYRSGTYTAGEPDMLAEDWCIYEPTDL